MDVTVAKFSTGLEFASGADTVPLQHVPVLRRLGHSVSILGGLNPHTEQGPWQSGYTVNSPQQAVSFRDVRSVVDHLLRNPPAILHTHTRGNGILCLADTLRARGTKIVHTMHGMDELREGDPARKLFELADCVTSPSPYAADQISALEGGRFAHKTFPFPNSTDIGRFRFSSYVQREAHKLRERHLVDSGRMVLITGRLQEDKGVFELGAAVAQLVEEGYNLTMMHVGPEYNAGQDRNRLYNIFKERGLENRLVTLDAVDPIKNPEGLAALYWACDFFAMPSDGTYENFPMSALEALAMEKPVIISAVGGPKSVFIDPGYAIGVPPRSVEGTKEAIRYMMNNFDTEKERARRVSRIVEAKYTTNVVVNQLSGIYSGLTGNN